MNQVEGVFSLLCKELAENKSVNTKRISEDKIKDSISSIFECSVGRTYSKEDLEKIISDGEERYKQKIPPGFKDAGNTGGFDVFSGRCRKYGDLIVWSQVIDKSLELKKSVILVTDDKKEDWWERFKSKTVGPRPELVKEFKDRADNSFYMYQTDRFLELARENLNQNVSEEIVEEVREVRRRDKLAYKRMKELEFVKRRKMKVHHLMEELDHLGHQMLAQEQELDMLQEKRYILESERDNLRELRNRLFHEDGKDIDTDRLVKNYDIVSEDYDQVRKHLEHSKAKYHEVQYRMTLIEQELSHGMKITEQENSADS